MPTTGILFSVMRRMSASLFYSRTVDLFVEVKERVFLKMFRNALSVCVYNNIHVILCACFSIRVREIDDLYDGETAINMDDEA